MEVKNIGEKLRKLTALEDINEAKSDQILIWAQHSINTGHPTTQDNYQIIGSKDHGIARTIKESIYIRVNNPTLKRNIGKFNLHHIWDRVLLNTP